jgi:hypothetical protein
MTHDPTQAHITHRDGTVFQVLIVADNFPIHLGWDEAATAKAYQAYEDANPPKKSWVSSWRRKKRS